MKQFLVKLIPYSIKRIFKILKYNTLVSKKGKPTTHNQKQALIYSFQRKYNVNLFIETGTFLGEMVSAMRYFFATLYSIELDPTLAKNALLQFKNETNIHIIVGDSSIELSKILSSLSEPAIFWLDGHYSGANTALGNKQCPVMEELEAISNYKHRAKSIILIDDARLFNGTNDYPKEEDIRKWADQYLPSHTMHMENDVICILPKNSSN